MRLIEKKCPNCGADLEFDENAKSCKCSYCKRSFEIERDVNDLDKINLVIDKVHKPIKAIFIIPFVLAFSGLAIFGFVFYNIFTTMNDDIMNENISNKKETVKLITHVDELTNDFMDNLERNSFSVLHQSVVGRNDTTYSYQSTGDPRLEKTFVISKKNQNYIILIYNIKYHNFFDQTDQKTVFVPVVYENVKNNTFQFNKPKNPAPEYYLNNDKSSYIYAYGSLDDAYNGVIKQYEDGYTITEK